MVNALSAANRIIVPVQAEYILVIGVYFEKRNGYLKTLCDN